MTKDEALDLALEALEYFTDTSVSAMDHAVAEDAITAIKQARALDKMAENARELGLDYEPVWCGHCNGSGRMVRDPDIGTDQECFVCDGAGVPAAPVQEPVAWGVFEGGNLHDMFFTKEEADNMAHLKGSHAEVKPLTTPPAAQRQWVGLTDAEVMQTMSGDWTSQFYFARAIEAKLKEKNNG